jgi:hypothetical protein
MTAKRRASKVTPKKKAATTSCAGPTRAQRVIQGAEFREGPGPLSI